MSSPIGPDHIYELTSLSGPTLSPDGLSLAFALSKIDRASMEISSQIMIASLAHGEPFPFTRGPKDSGPRFSPGGQTVAFLRPDEADRKQVWLIPVSGGEARQLTQAAAGVTEFAWSPDSRALVFASDVDPDPPPDGHDSKAHPRVRVVRRLQYRADAVGWRGDSHSHLFVIGVGGEGLRQLTDGDWDDSAPTWSPDMSRIAFISGRRQDRDSVPHNEAYVVPSHGGEAACWSHDLSGVGSVAWSPDGTRLAVIGSDDDAIGPAWQGWIFVLEPGLPPTKLTDDSIKPVAGYAPITLAPEMRWTEDGRILFLADSRGESYLVEAREGGGAPRRVTGGGAQFSAVSIDGRGERAVALAASPSSPVDLHLVDVATGSRRQLTDYNREYLEGHPPARLQKFAFSRKDLEIECRLLLPPGFDERRRYPAVVDIHGGPHGTFYDAFNSVQQVLATAGYLVLCVNPRGSSTYGAWFAKEVLEDWGGEDYLDIMAAVEEVCSRGYVDASRLGVHGYSYGGYMTSWIIGHDTRFAAAVVGAPCIDLPSMYGTSDIGVTFGERQWGGSRAEAGESMRSQSPLTYADRVQTPVLLLHGESDLRCPIEQSEQYFVTLKRLEKEVEFVRFPGCSHSLLRSGHPRMREEYLARTLAWFNRHLAAPQDETS